MKKIIFLFAVLILAGCTSTENKIIKTIEKECKISTKKEINTMGNSFYWYFIDEKQNPFKIEQDTKNIIDRILNCLPSKKEEDIFDPNMHESYYFYKWETPQIEIQMKYSWSHHETSNKWFYELKIWIDNK